jgi:hypothetical protein
MGPRAAAETAFLVLGVYLTATAVPMLVVAVAGALMTKSDAGGALPWFGSIGYAASALVGGGVVAFRTSLVDLLTISPSEDRGPATNAVQAAAFSVIGVLFLAGGASGLLKQVGLAVFPSPHFGGATWQNTVGPLAELVGVEGSGIGARVASPHGVVKRWQIS